MQHFELEEALDFISKNPDHYFDIDWRRHAVEKYATSLHHISLDGKFDQVDFVVFRDEKELAQGKELLQEAILGR